MGPAAGMSSVPWNFVFSFALDEALSGGLGRSRSGKGVLQELATLSASAFISFNNCALVTAWLSFSEFCAEASGAKKTTTMAAQIMSGIRAGNNFIGSSVANSNDVCCRTVVFF